MSKKVFVIGATGRIGSELVKLLVQNNHAVRAASRNPSADSSKFQKIVEVVEFDYDKPQTFASALIGVEKIFLIVKPGDNHSDKAAIPLIDLAKKAKVKLIVDITAMGVEQDDTFMLRILEKYIESSGISYTHLRPNWFMQNFDTGPMFADIKATGALHLPAADAKISFIDLRDIAAVGYKVLTESKHKGKAYTLTGKESLSYKQTMEKISRVVGNEISYIPISEDNARTVLAKRGVSIELIDRWTNFYRKVRQGDCSPISMDVEMILGRSPILFDQYVIDNATSWR